MVYEEDKLIYMDMKIKRQSTTDNRTSLFVRDSAGREIYSILYDKGKMLPGSYETLSADVNYGSYDSEIPINYPRDDQWHFIRTIFNFDSKTFKIYIGTSADDLEPMVPSEPDIGFKDPDASDLYSIAASDDGEVRWYATTLAIDDLKIYSVSLGGATIPVASDITLEGKPNIGEILTGRYGTFSDTKEEGSSYCYWETSDDINFMDPVKITEDTPIASGGTNNLVLSEAHKGKYIRFVVVPVNIDGDEGSPAYSTTDYKIGCITYTLKTTGATKGGGTKFEPKYDDNYYAGSIDIVNTSDQEFNAILIAAWYQDDQFKKLYTAPVSVAAGTSEDSGVVTASISTDSEHFTRFAIPENTELKILLWDDLSNIKPLTAFLKIIS